MCMFSVVFMVPRSTLATFTHWLHVCWPTEVAQRPPSLGSTRAVPGGLTSIRRLTRALDHN